MKEIILMDDLQKACDKFEHARRKRLKEKELKGWSGWDEHPDRWKIRERLLKKANKLTRKMTTKDCVDIANFANFIYAYLKMLKV
jgi:hypothetical protein